MSGPQHPEPAKQVELETKISFLEHTVEALNEVILEQGRLLERLTNRLARLEAQAGGDDGDDSDLGDLESHRPPHY